mgnify:FL=1
MLTEGEVGNCIVGEIDELQKLILLEQWGEKVHSFTLTIILKGTFKFSTVNWKPE